MFPHPWRKFVKGPARFDGGRRRPARPTAFRPRIEAFEDRLVPTFFLVTSTDDSGPGTLRQAILDSNQDTTGTNTIDFNIATGFLDVKTIQPTSPLPAITQSVVIDGTTQPGLPGNPLIVLNGAAAGAANGLTITGSNSTVRRLVINGFQQQAISVEGPGGGNRIVGNYLGTDTFGGTPVPNGAEGVGITGSTNNTIGGTTPADRNIISGNTLAGVALFGNAAGNVVLGNFIGVDTTSYSNLGNGGPGIRISDGANHNTIGGTTTGAGNVISANAQEGIAIAGADVTANVVQGNHIGNDSRGVARIPNGLSGVILFGEAHDNTIGGDVSGAGNVLSANSGAGLVIEDAGTTGNLVQGNLIGTNARGTASLANGSGQSGVSILNAAANNTIGGTTAGARNIISGNSGGGVSLSDSGTTDNVIEGNYIGTDISGSVGLGNTSAGVSLTNEAAANTIGGAAAGAGNVISGNDGFGINLSGDGVANNLVQGNFIGTDRTGTAFIGNRASGVNLMNAAAYNTIGGTTAGARNLISANAVDGIAISGNNAGTTGNLIEGNYIGTDVTGTVALGNYDGVYIRDQVTGNTVGGTEPGAGNLISGNDRDGIQLFQTPGHLVQGNRIGTDATGMNPLGNLRDGIFVSGAAANDNTIGGTDDGAGNTIRFNGADGVFMGGSTGNVILRNSIFSNTRLGIENNNQAVPNLASAVSDSSSITIAGTLTSTPNDTFTLEFFSNIQCNPSGFGEGQTYLGSLTLALDDSGTMDFMVTFPVAVDSSMFITATATGTIGNTSGFSLCLPITTQGDKETRRQGDKETGMIPVPWLIAPNLKPSGFLVSLFPCLLVSLSLFSRPLPSDSFWLAQGGGARKVADLVSSIHAPSFGLSDHLDEAFLPGLEQGEW